MNTNERENFESTAYAQLKQAIIEGIYPPGSQIAEEAIAAQLDMSRSPVRSAIKRLEAEGFLEKRANRHMYVTYADAKRALDALYIRKALEGMASYQAALNYTSEDAAAMQSVLDQMNECLSSNDLIKILRLFTDIHKVIYAASKNVQLQHIGINLLDQEAIFSFRSLNTEPSRIRSSYEEHAALVAAIFARDAQLAEKKAREHIDILIDRIQRIYEKEPKSSSLLIRY